MRRPPAEFERIADAVEVGARARVVVAGEAIDLAGSPADARAGLSGLLYRRLYCRPGANARAQALDSRALRIFVERLSEANGGRGCWEPGWDVQAIEPDGALIVRRAGEALAVWAPLESFRPTAGDGGVGTTGRLRIGKELREMLPGFYMALGDADAAGDGADGPLARFYWHLTADAAPAWIAAITRCLNNRAIPFRAKVLSDPGSYTRADAGVLYVGRAHLPEALAAIPEVHRAVARGLRGATPMFTKRLTRGLGYADDPGGGQSFGQHRCDLVAEALLGLGTDRGTDRRAVAAAIAARFVEAGLDVRFPWLNAGCEDDAAWTVGR
jgi:hypothetical protein